MRILPPLSSTAYRFLFGIDFLIIPIAFYFIVFVAGFELDSLRRDGWLFEVAKHEEKWYRFYTYFGALYLDLGDFFRADRT